MNKESQKKDSLFFFIKNKHYTESQDEEPCYQCTRRYVPVVWTYNPKERCCYTDRFSYEEGFFKVFTYLSCYQERYDEECAREQESNNGETCCDTSSYQYRYNYVDLWYPYSGNFCTFFVDKHLPKMPPQKSYRYKHHNTDTDKEIQISFSDECDASEEIFVQITRKAVWEGEEIDGYGEIGWEKKW